jgi:hypothetical protein
MRRTEVKQYTPPPVERGDKKDRGKTALPPPVEQGYKKDRGKTVYRPPLERGYNNFPSGGVGV